MNSWIHQSYNQNFKSDPNHNKTSLIRKKYKKKKTKKNLLEKYTVKFFQMLGLENKVQLTYNIKDIFFVFVS